MISNRMILAILCVLLLAGCGVIYLFDNDDYNVEFESSADTVEYRLKGFMPCDYTCRVYSNTDVPERMYFYRDDSYTHFYDNTSQATFFNNMERVLKARNYDSIEYVDANQLKSLIDNPSKAPGSMIMIVSGSMPDTIIEDGISTLFTKWMYNDGTVFWAGPEIGRYVSHIDDYTESETGRPFIGHVCDGTDEQDIESISELGLVSGFSLKNCIQYGLENDYPGSVCLSTCSSDYSSASVVKYSNGRIYMVGGKLVDSVLPTHTALAEVLICGINEDTSVKSSESFSKMYGDVSGSVNVSSGDVLILTIGKPYSSWARCYIVP